MKKIALIGSTGSIGKQVIDVVKAHPDKFEIVAMVANSSYAEFERQINELPPTYAALTDISCAEKVREIPSKTKYFKGEKSALSLLAESGADVAFIACGGFAGLKYSLEAMRLNMDIALANKETLVCGGDLVMPNVKNLMPVDSEHSALWQCLNYDRKGTFKNLIITASGGPFRDREWQSLSSVTPEQALNHPTWKMGKKITIDSATLLNKGYEVIEAHHLYNAPYERIKTVIQPTSIIHSLVEFEDGAVLAQMSNPTMELPIQLALTYPERYSCSLKPMDFSKALSIEFLPLVRERYPMYDLALSCGENGGVLPTALNAASEQSVWAFINKKIPFTAIYDVTNAVVQATKNAKVESYSQLEEVDAEARRTAEKIIGEYYHN